MNMILAGDGHNNIEHKNSFTNESKLKHENAYDVILTNIPFLNRKFADFKNVYFSDSGQEIVNGNSINIYHCLHSLNESNPNSRIIMIVPDSVLISDDYFELRKHIFNKTKIEFIISLPTGTFFPYASNAKTSILYLTNNSNNTKYSQKLFSKKISFPYWKIENVGYKAKKKKYK